MDELAGKRPVSVTLEGISLDLGAMRGRVAQLVYDAIREERERCAKLVDGWYEFESKEGGTRLCVACNHSKQVADAIRDPAKEKALEDERKAYYLMVEEQRRKI